MAVITLFQVLKQVNSGPKEAEFNLTQFSTDVEQGTVKEVDVTGMEVKGKLANGTTFHTTAPGHVFHSGNDQEDAGQGRQRQLP